MIISASRRTDIPAFYSEWFERRVIAGSCRVPNPFNSKQVSEVSLAPEDVDAVVFWSKDPAPMLPRLSVLEDRGIPCVFLFTLNDYPKALEPGLPPLARRLETFLALAERLGPERVAWRYDPVIITPATPRDAHARAFEALARALEGATRRVYASLLAPYRKTRRRMAPLAGDGYVIEPGASSGPDSAPDSDLCDSVATRDMLAGFSATARERGIEPLWCAGELDLSGTGFGAGACIDPEWLAALGVTVGSRKHHGQRPDCRCVVSRDIGVNDTCLHGCVYCYATRSDAMARTRSERHDLGSSVLYE